MKVSELAERAGTTASTVRFYEAEGALPAPPRAANGYREYAAADLERLRLIVAFRGLGLELDESGRLAELCASGRCDRMSADLAARIPERRAAIAAAIEELRHLDASLARLETGLADGTPVSVCLTDDQSQPTPATPAGPTRGARHP